MAAIKERRPIISTLIKGDPSFADLVEEFVAGLPERLTAMESALEEPDFQRAKVLAHQLKGSGGGYGFPDLTDIASKLESEAIERNLTACLETLDELNQLVSRVINGAKLA
jgi:HPt (histidine-containing phosphotransfer) domain-containing protein